MGEFLAVQGVALVRVVGYQLALVLSALRISTSGVG
jgi:hypothetical protein